jgi:hypothetical protein
MAAQRRVRTSSGKAGRKAGSRNGSRTNGSGASARSRQTSTTQLEGRAPSTVPDVYVDIEKVKVDEIYVDVEHLEAHLALRAKLANLFRGSRAYTSTSARSR